MKIKSGNTQKREILIILASISTMAVLMLLIFLFSRSLAKKAEEVYSAPKPVQDQSQEANFEKYNEVVNKIFPDGAPGLPKQNASSQPAQATSPSSTVQ